ncbi:MAG: RHS repeat protein, partial [Chloroflexi bacterium]|nr:RHS repeat protein [Chloroflexota bacterium]
GDVTLYDYDSQGNLISETNHYSDTVAYTYNQFGQRASVTDENGVTTQFGYDAWGQMRVITDALNRTSHFEYDVIGRLITSTDTVGRVTVNEYDGGNNLIRVIENIHPTVTTQNYLELYNIVTEYEYDGVGNQTAVTNTVGQVERFFFDEAGRVVTHVVNYTATLPLCDFNQPQSQYNICNLTAYDGLGRVEATTDNIGRIERTFYDDKGQVAGIVKNWTGAIASAAD